MRTYNRQLRLRLTMSQQFVCPQVVFEAPAKNSFVRSDLTHELELEYCTQESCSDMWVCQPHLPRSLTASSNRFWSMAFCTSWV